MAIGGKSEESVATISSSFSSVSSFTKTSLSSLFHSILLELDGLHKNVSSIRRASMPSVNSGKTKESTPSHDETTHRWKFWGLCPTLLAVNAARGNLSESFVSHQHDHVGEAEDNEVDQQLHCRHPSHHRPFSFHREKLNSLTLHLTVVLVFTTIFACFPNSVGSSTTDEKERLVCIKGISNSFPGATYPRGDIFLMEGDTLEVFCKLNLTHPVAKGYNASNIDFNFFKADIPRDKVFIRVLNESTAVVRVKRMNASNSLLRCLLRGSNGTTIPVCQNTIDVGYPPLPVDNFRCISKEWKSLKCSWDLPSNPVPTKYKLTKLWKAKMPVSCPNTTATPNSCTWDGRTEPYYRATVDPLIFRLNGTNALVPSGVTWEYSISLGPIVIPEKPTIHILKRSAAEYMLNWTFPNFEFFQYGLVHELKICCEYEEKCNVTEYETRPYEKRMTPYLEKNISLPHAYANYTFSVRLRSLVANKTEEFWSEPDTKSVETDGRAPDFPPETDIGSFESKLSRIDLRDVYIYWQSIPAYLKNGPKFKYDIEVYENDRKIDRQPQEIKDSYAKFSGLSIGSTYHFNITSVNAYGRSANSSHITVSSISQLTPEPKVVSKVDFTNGSFEISWSRPDRHEGIVSYTVFSCASNKPPPYPCEGPLEWDRVDSTKMRKFFSPLSQYKDHQYEFAVSANTDTLGSGMVWASCTLFHDKVPEKLKYVEYKELSEDEILIKWDLTCSYKAGGIEGFKITYCQVEKNLDEGCKDDESSVAVEGANTTSYRLVKLQPYSYYKVYVSILSEAGESPRSSPVYAKTLEGAPSYARVSKVSEVTNVSATLYIDSPLNPNGVLRRYVIYYRAQEDREQELPVTLKDTNGTQEVTLKNLMSYSNYSVSVVACTTPVKCSGRSQPFFFVTDIGRTDLHSYPRISWSDGHIELEWDKPDRVGGPIDYFEIMLKKNGELVTNEEDGYPSEPFTIGTKKFHRSLPEVACERSTNFTAQIRAVTKLDSGFPLYGAWSAPGNHSCGGGTSWIIWVILAVVVIIGAAFFGFLSMRFYNYFKRMKESLTIKLPPGLNSELNGFAHKPPPRGRSNENLYGKETYAYPLQPTSTQSDESKDFLSNSEANQGEAEESLIEKPFSPSPTNPLLGPLNFSRTDDNSVDDEENDIRLTDFTHIQEDRHSSPTYKKLGVLSNGSAVAIELMPGPSSQSSPRANSQSDEVSTSSPSHTPSQISNHIPNHIPSNPPSLRVEPTTPNGINRTVPDVLSSSPASPTSLNSNSSLTGTVEASLPPSPPVQPAPSSSYVKWTTLVPDMKTGDAGGVLDNSNRQSPYCQVGILLDS